MYLVLNWPPSYIQDSAICAAADRYLVTNEYPLNKYFVAFWCSTSMCMPMYKYMHVCMLVHKRLFVQIRNDKTPCCFTVNIYILHNRRRTGTTATTWSMAQLQATRCEVNTHSLTQDAPRKGCEEGKTLNITCCCHMCKYLEEKRYKQQQKRKRDCW